MTTDATRATAKALPKAARPRHYAETLSFMRVRPAGKGIDYWCVTPTGKYGIDCETGFRLANEFLKFIGEQPTIGHCRLLNCIVQEIHEGAATGKEFTGVEAGFFMRINEAATAAAAFLMFVQEGGAA